MNLKIPFALTVCLGVPCSQVMADTVLGVYAGAGQWQYDFAGEMGQTDTDITDLGFQDDNANTLYVALEHPVPLLPNLMVKQVDLAINGSASLADNLQFDDQLFLAGEAVQTKIDLKQQDATFYYEVLDNWLNLDLGVTIRSFSGELTAVSSATAEAVDLDVIVPLGYIKGQVDLPLTGFSVKADANAVAYSGDSISDVSAALSWSNDVLVAFDLGVEVGYRRMKLDLDDLGDINSSLTMDGPYLSINAHF